MPILHAELQIDGQQARCTAARYSFLQTIDDQGRPNSDLRFGRIEVTLTGGAAAWPMWEEIKLDHYCRKSGHLVYFGDEGQTVEILTFYNAALVHLKNTLNSQGQNQEAAMQTTLHFSAAMVEVQGQRVQAYSTIPWTTDHATNFRALTPPPPLLPSLALRAETLAQELPVKAADFMRFNKEKKPLTERPQSKKTGYLGSPKLTKAKLATLAKVAEEKHGASVQVIKPEEMNAFTGSSDVRAVFQTEFDPITRQRAGTIYVQKGATAYELTHEMMHAKQFQQLGYEAYWQKQTRLQREEFVFEELIKTKQQLSAIEIKHATDYIYSLKHGHWPNNK